MARPPHAPSSSTQDRRRHAIHDRHRSPPPHAHAALPDALGRFGAFGGRFVPETLMDALNQLDRRLR